MIFKTVTKKTKMRRPRFKNNVLPDLTVIKHSSMSFVFIPQNDPIMTLNVSYSVLIGRFSCLSTKIALQSFIAIFPE
jgi:hypothetical protein